MHKTLNFDSNCRALIIGASGGIGSSLPAAIDRLYGTNDIVEISRSTDGLDITNEESIKNQFVLAAGCSRDQAAAILTQANWQFQVFQ